MRRVSVRIGRTLFNLGIFYVASSSWLIAAGGKFLASLLVTGIGFCLALFTFGNTQWVPGKGRDPFDPDWWREERELLFILVLAILTFLASLAFRGVRANVIASGFGYLLIGVLLLNAVGIVWFFSLSGKEDAETDTPKPAD